MNYAIIIDGIVNNIAVANYPVKDNWVEVDAAEVHIGDSYDGQNFYQNKEHILTEELLVQNADMKNALNLLGVSVYE